MNIVLFDEENVWRNLLPLTFTRPISKIRIGILSIDEKWKHNFKKADISYLSLPHLSDLYPAKLTETNYFINGSVIPNGSIPKQVKSLKQNEGLAYKGTLIAFNGSEASLRAFNISKTIEATGEVMFVKNVYDIFKNNGECIKADFDLITKGRKSKALAKTVTVIGNKKLVFVEQGASINASILNTTGGAIYIGKDAEVMEGCTVRGPFALGEHSVLKMSAKIYGPTTIGPHSKVGGEVNNSVIFGYSNKAHDGFLGNSVVGEWCNLGADTNNSNLKNNYGNVKLYNYLQQKSVDTGMQFCGLIMGDYSKTGINTMLNTGTVVGVAANIFGAGFPPAHIPSFSWGGAEGFDTYQSEKLFETSEKVFERRGIKFGDKEKKMLNAVFDLSVKRN
jgi:UDP-N-acetylglucosamine diphosphorylase/glucosamine-1-phosphate N-acetyltransferase